MEMELPMETQMPIEVKVTANFAKLIGGQRSAQAEGSTIGELLDDLDQRHPGFKQNVVADGRIHRFVNVYLNDEDVRFLQQLDTPIREGDIISVLPALAGG
jgi:sulfur-carrier protein